jgi:curved DNA-binding protein CbpA
LDTIKNYYEILQVSPSADQGVIEVAYRRLAREFHADASSGTEDADRMKEINEAFEVLGDSARRQEYDQARRLNYTDLTPSGDARRHGIPAYVWFAGLAIGIIGIIVTGFILLPGGDDERSNSLGLVSCGALQDLDSYRYSLELKLDAPAFEDTSSPAPDDPLNAFAEALTSLFSDMRLQGAFAAPDRSQVVLDFEGEELEWRSIGDQTWVRFADKWEEQESSAGDELLTPEVVCEDIVLDIASSLSDAAVEDATVNGIDTYHYSVDSEHLEDLPPLLLGPDSGNLPDDLSFDVWLAKEGLWPVQLSFSASDTDDSGQTVELSLDMQVRDINDPGITIEPPPTDAGAQGS